MKDIREAKPGSLFLVTDSFYMGTYSTISKTLLMESENIFMVLSVEEMAVDSYYPLLILILYKNTIGSIYMSDYYYRKIKKIL